MKPTDPRLRRQLAPARRPLAVVLVAGVIGSLLLVAQAWVVTGLVLAVVRDGAVLEWAVAVAAVFVLRSLVGWTSDALAARAAALIGTDVRRRVVAAILRRPLAGGSASGEPGRSSGELAALATRGASAAEPYLTRYVPALVLAGVLPLVTVVVIATQDLLSALIVLLTLPLIPIFGILVGLATRERAESQWRALASLSGHFLDVMRGLPTLVAFRRARVQSATIRSVTDRYRRATVETLRIAFASSAVLELVATLSVALVAVTVGIRLAQGGLELETALVVLLLAPEAYWPLRRVGAEFHAAAEGVATFEAVGDLDDSGAGTTSAPAPSRVEVGEGPILLDRVSVVRPGRTVAALAETSLEIPARGVTAVTGPSGCGKSTLLTVLAGLLEPTTGTLAAPARDRIALLPQRPVFVSGSIADNLRLADPHATDERLWEVLRRVALEERVRSLPAGLATALGEDGATLSAGERARLALARVVLADRPWVLLDEPTAHLDAVTERVVADTVQQLGRERAVVVVAHRPALVELADRVVELAPPRTATRPDRGPAAEAGPRRPVPRTHPIDPEEPAGRRRGLGLPTTLGGLSAASGVALTATAGWLIVQASTQPPILTLMVAIVGVRLFGLARPVLRYAERLRSHDVVLRQLAERRVAVYEAVVPLTPGALGRRRGDLLASVVDDVDSVLDRQLRVRMPVREFGIAAVLTTLVVALVEPRALPPVAATWVLGGGLGYLVARAGAARAEARAIRDRARLSEAVVEVAQTAPEIVMWQAEDRALSRVAAISDEIGAAAVTAARWLATARALVLLVSGLGVGATALAIAPVVAQGALSGSMAALLVLTPLALGEVAGTLADAGALAVRTQAAEERLDDLAARRPVVEDPADPLPLDESVRVRAEDVAAGWGGQVALDGLDLDLAPGARVAVVGPTGSGKSTLAALLLRFIDPVAGRVRLGSRALPELALDDVRRTVGLVDDDPHLFASTLAENVRLARPGATDAEVEAALRRARLGPWLDDLPDGLGTWVGDGHADVSGGERARIAIARSLLADQPVLVLDEPAAHLDGATAEELAAEVLEPGERTVVWITHTDTGLDRVDRVVDLGAVAPGPAATRSRGPAGGSARVGDVSRR